MSGRGSVGEVFYSVQHEVFWVFRLRVSCIVKFGEQGSIGMKVECEG